MGLQASAGAAEHEARSRVGKILATVVDSPSKSEIVGDAVPVLSS